MRLLIVGAIIVGISWFAAWSRLGIVSEYAFFPLWLGYILLVNGVSEAITGSSLLSRMRGLFLLLFAASVPMWWFFEYMNSIVHNWHYVFAHSISTFHYNLQASIDFSTVIPAVLSISFLIFHFLRSVELPSRSVRISRAALIVALGSSLVLFALMDRFPNEMFPLVWIIPILFIEPICYRFNPDASLLRLVEHGQFALPLSVGLGTLATGFWWECWNFYSLPKWIYTIPYVDFWNIFEMPFLGYFGYPFFGIVVFGYTSLVLHFFAARSLVDLFVRADRDNG